jgi:hypothetical protein
VRIRIIAQVTHTLQFDSAGKMNIMELRLV